MSLVRLRLLILPTCVGFRYGFVHLNLVTISWHLDYVHLLRLSSQLSPQLISSRNLTRESTHRCLDRDNRRPAGFHLMRHDIEMYKVLEYKPTSHRLRFTA